MKMIFKKDINDILFCEFIIFILFFTFLSIIGIYVKKGDIMENTFDMKGYKLHLIKTKKFKRKDN